MSDAAIQVEGLSKRYRLGATPGLGRRVASWARGRRIERDDFWALKGVTFEVPRGEVLGVVGGNGAGKSTLLKVLSRITDPSGGRAVVRGRVGSLLEVGTGFHPELTGRENIFLSGAVLGMSRAEVKRRFDEIVDFAGVEAFLGTPVKRYSSGMYVRLAFAVAAHLQPEVLIVDEVLAVGDASFQSKCLGRMSAVADSGRTVLFVSHNMGAISSLCRRAILLRRGELTMEGDAAAVIGEYLGGGERKGVVDLTDASVERRGDGKARLTALRVIDTATGRPLESVIAGRDVTIEASYRGADPSRELRRLVLGMAVFTARGHLATVLMSEMAGLKVELAPGEGVLRCRVPRLPLMSGRYSVMTTLKVDGAMTDQVPAALSLEVHQGDYFASGQPNDQGLQATYIDQAWTGPTDAEAAFADRRVA